MVSRVAFPIYAKLQDDPEKLSRAYTRVLNLTLLVCAPVSGLIFALAPDFTRIFLGAKWEPMVPVLQLLSIYGMLRALEGTTDALFIATGRPKVRVMLQLCQLALMAAAIFPLCRSYGINGAAGAMVIYTVLANPPAVALALHLTGSRFGPTLRVFAFAAGATLLLIGAIEGIKAYLMPQFSLPVLIAAAAGAAAIYLALAALLREKLHLEWILYFARRLPLLAKTQSGMEWIEGRPARNG
jgi:lipopolysaccharide exporter